MVRAQKESKSGLAARARMGKTWLWSSRSRCVVPLQHEQASDLEKGLNLSCFHIEKGEIGQLSELWSIIQDNLESFAIFLREELGSV